MRATLIRGSVLLAILLAHGLLIDQAIRGGQQMPLPESTAPVTEVELIAPTPSVEPAMPVPPVPPAPRPASPVPVAPKPAMPEPARVKPPAKAAASARKPRPPERHRQVSAPAATQDAGHRPDAARSEPTPAPEAGVASGRVGAGPSVPEGGSGSGLEPAGGARTPPAPLLYGSPLPPPPAVQRWRYDLHYGDYQQGGALAQMEVSLSVDGDRYRLASTGEALGITSLLYRGQLRQVSEGRFGDNGLQPLRYVEDRGKRGERMLRFDPDRGELIVNGDAAQSAPAGVQDRLSGLIQLGLIIGSDPGRYPAGTSFDMAEASFGGVRKVRYRSEGVEVLVTPQGPMQTLHLVRDAGVERDDLRIDLWYGFQQRMLPVRVKATDPYGRVLDQIIQPIGG